MGVCSSCSEMLEHEKAEQQKQQADEQRRLLLESSERVELHSTSPKLTLQLREAHTVLEVLQIVASEVGLPKNAAQMLRMEFAEHVVARQKTLVEEALCDQAQFSVPNVEDVRAKLKAEADEIDIHSAVAKGHLDDVQLVCWSAPEKVNAKSSMEKVNAKMNELETVFDSEYLISMRLKAERLEASGNTEESVRLTSMVDGHLEDVNARRTLVISPSFHLVLHAADCAFWAVCKCACWGGGCDSSPSGIMLPMRLGRG